MPESSLEMPRGCQSSESVCTWASLLNMYELQSLVILSKRCLRCEGSGQLLIRPLEADIAGRRPNLQHRTASVQLALRVERPRTPLVTFAGDMDVREVGGNVVPIAQVHAGTHAHRHIRRNVDRNVACGGLQHGIAALCSGVDELHRNPTRSSLHPRRRDAIEFDGPRAGIRTHSPFCRSQANAATAGLNFRRTPNVPQVDTASARRRFDTPQTTPYVHVPAARFDHSALIAGKHNHIASASFRVDPPFHRLDRNV